MGLIVTALKRPQTCGHAASGTRGTVCVFIYTGWQGGLGCGPWPVDRRMGGVVCVACGAVGSWNSGLSPTTSTSDPVF